MNKQFLEANNAYTELTDKIIRYVIQQQSDKKEKVFDFSADQYSLLRIGIFATLSRNVQASIVEVNISNNRLIQIDSINVFQNLKKLNISHNKIRQFYLTIEKLDYLDASYNQLQAFPKLEKQQELTYLNLAGNQIVEIQAYELENLSKKIQYLNFSKNKIKFKHGSILYGLIKTLGNNLRQLNKLYFEGNPFIVKDPLIWIYFLIQLQGIQIINGLDYDQLRAEKKRQESQNQGNFILADLEDMVYDDSLDMDEENAMNQISKELNTRIEMCIDDPSKCTQQLKILQERAETIIQCTQDQWQYMFLREDEEEQDKIIENLDNFLQHCFIFCQNQQNYIKEVMVILVQFAVIPQLQFGRKCFELFVETIRSGKGNIGQIAQELIKQYSVPQIQNCKFLNDVPPFVMEGIVKCIEERQEKDLVPINIVDNFRVWLDQMIDIYKDKSIIIREEQIQRDIIFLNLIYQLGKFKEYIVKYNENLITEQIRLLFRLILKRNLLEHQIILLKTIENICMNDEKVTQEILNKKHLARNFLKTLEEELAFNIFVFKKFHNSMVNPETKENKEYIQLKYENFEAIIRCYSSLMHRNIFKVDAKDFEKQLEGEYFMNELLIMTTIPALHPNLINGLVLFTFRLLTNPSILYSELNAEFVKYIGTKIQNGVTLLQYLGGVFYVPMIKQMMDNKSKNITKNLSTQTNPKVQELFQNIVNIIRFFSENCINEKSNIAGVCQEISSQLNKHNREDALFITLATPSDDVRLSIVQCLLTIKQEELDTKEVAQLVALLPQYSNLGAGRTESIISNIVMILTKVIAGSNKASQDGKRSQSLNDFITIYSENAIKDSLDILVRNMERDLRMDLDEQDEKLELAVGVVNFLKSLSLDSELRRNLKGFEQAQCMKNSLTLEEALLTENVVGVEIERTWIGKYCENLLIALYGKESLFPFGKVWERVFIRMAENLEGKGEDYPEDLSDFDGIYNGKKIIKKIMRENTKRREQQLEVWDVMKRGLSEIPIWDQKRQKSDEYLIFENQHKLFASQEAVINLLHYLFGRNQNTKAMELDSYLTTSIAQHFHIEKQFDAIKIYITDQILDFQTKNNNKKKEKIKIKNKDTEFQSILCSLPNAFDPLRGIYKEFPHFDPTKGILTPFISKIKTIKAIQGRLDKHNEHIQDNIIPPSRRVISVCAYLRIVYAMLMYTPVQETGLKVADQISGSFEYLKELTFLCEWAGWKEGNIAAKYLCIMNIVLERSIACRRFNFVPSYFILSHSLKAILSIIEKMLKEDDKRPLTDDDKILIKEACQYTGNLILNCKFISFQAIVDDDLKLDDDNKYDKNEARRVVTNNAHEYFLTQIIPIHSFKVFLQTMTWDMKATSQLTKFFIKNLNNLLKYRSLSKSSLQLVLGEMRKWLVFLIGAYVVECQSVRKEVLQMIIQFEVFDKAYIRYAFIQDILDMSLDLLYEENVQKVILSQKLLPQEDQKSEGNTKKKNKKVSETIEKYMYFGRCFLENQENDSIKPVALIILRTEIVIADVNVYIDRRLDVHKPGYLNIKNITILLRVPIKNVEGFYSMESQQRVCFTYSKSYPGPFDSNTDQTILDSLEVQVLFFKQMGQWSQLESTCRLLRMNSGEDYISNLAWKRMLGGKVDQCIWVVKSPSEPLIDRSADFATSKRFILTFAEGKIYLLLQNLEEWFLIQPKRFTVQKTLSKKHQKFETDKERINRSIEQMFWVKTSFDLSQIQKIQFEQTLNPVVNISFGILNKLTILFGCDNAREKFKQKLAEYVDGIDSFKLNAYIV